MYIYIYPPLHTYPTPSPSFKPSFSDGFQCTNTSRETPPNHYQGMILFSTNLKTDSYMMRILSKVCLSSISEVCKNTKTKNVQSHWPPS